MKISLGINLQEGPWGGGNQFGHALARYLRRKRAEVHFDLRPDDLDIIVLTEPRSNLRSSSFSDRDVIEYLNNVNSRALVVHRVNECDERKGTSTVNRRLKQATLCADHTVFISGWLRDLFLAQGMKPLSYSVIYNGADPQIFRPNGRQRSPGAEPLRLVTHHWSAHRRKGFDIYGRLDEMLSDPARRRRVAFSYVGNVPEGWHFRNAAYHPPQSGPELATTIRAHDVYLTASQNEPAGMHHIEGAMCGLPLFYRRSGALTEYCDGFGVGFTYDDFEDKLEQMLEQYDLWAARMKHYPYTSERMCDAYHRLFLDLHARRDNVLRHRSQWRWLKWHLFRLRLS